YLARGRLPLTRSRGAASQRGATHSPLKQSTIEEQARHRPPFRSLSRAPRRSLRRLPADRSFMATPAPSAALSPALPTALFPSTTAAVRGPPPSTATPTPLRS